MGSHLFKALGLLSFLLFFPAFSHSQDIHFSHIHASPTILNPATNGLFEGKIRVIANARSQWNSVTKGYKTVVASSDMKLFTLNKNDILSGGIQLYSDRAGDLDFTTTSTALAFSYLKAFDKRGRNYLSFGIQNSWVQQSVDYTKIEAFGNISAFNKNLVQNVVTYWDFNAGMAWFFKPDKRNSFYIGFSALHLNNPNIGFINAESSKNAVTLYRRFNLHGGATLKISKKLTFKPSFLFMDQGPHQEITFGSFIRYRTYRRGLSKRPLHFIYAGAWFRSYLEKDAKGIDALVASIKYEFRNLSIALSYDINLSTYRLASGGRGGLELSIIKVFDWPEKKRKNKKIKCPIM